MQQSIGLITRISLVVSLVLLCFSFSCQQQAQVGLTEEEAEALFEPYLKIYNEANLAIADDVIHPEFVLHHCNFPEDLVGIETFKGFVANNAAAFPDFKLTFDKIITKDDKIVTLWTAEGTNTGPLGELPPTGKKVRISGLAISRVANGKFAEEWLYFNFLDFYQQLGFTLTPPQRKK